ncbi:hypothetical protein ARMGADRAFT_1061145 [Armillaria gallica]|uniref:Uncharacterized protein n=1 Tax=Armillaria gallica TaxID=47427 RepID=A0A2H3DMN7_ARMGA|nr:hypothetical protein ARMGADRAFT_1061145 [Armillaria gallica]
MSSSSSQDDHRRLQRPAGIRQLTRRNSSFLTSVKNYVPKPLARLFSGSEEFDDSKDEMGKRRRLDGQQNEPVDGNDDSPAPKRLRLRSPDRASSQPPPHTASGYLDPPSSAFQPFFHPSHLSNDPSNRSSSLTLPATTVSDIPRNEPRTTLSPLRNQFSRTMSIDPPRNPITRRLSRDATMQSVVLPPLHGVAARDMSMEPAPGSFLRSSGSQIRDTSLPLGFRVRTSVTPQPVRDSSEPPTISSLGSKPVFVRGPAPEASKPQTTLGSLVDTQRRTQSPVRQHSSSSLLFGSQSTSVKGSRPTTTAERTLHELDIYRTPLKPSRLRENSSLASSPGGATDMFSRKKSYQRMPGGRTVKAKVANQTKPYAGDAGIKKHLARSRKASVEEVVPTKGELNDDDVPMNEGRPLSDILPEINKDRGEFRLSDNQPKTSKAVEKQSTMPSSSSLRVGRTFTSRNHIDRPSRPGKNGFSAAYDDGEDEEREEESRKEREMMEEAAKHVPVFNIPAGFSFAKDTDKPQDVASDLSKAKEPPIPSLPFSISSFQSGTSSVSSATSIPPSNGSELASAAASPFTPPTPAPDISAKVASVPASSTTETLPKANGGIPDFFASSKTVTQTPLVVPPMTLTAAGASAPASLPFSLTPPQQPRAATPAPSAPVHDADNPLWNGVKKDDTAGKAQNEPAPSSDVNGGGGIFAFGGSGTTASFPLFGPAKQDGGPQASIPAESAYKPSSFSFGGTPESSSVAESTAPPPLFSIAPAKTAEPDQAQKPLTLTFGSSNVTKETTNSNAFSFGQTPNNSTEPKTNGFFAKQIEAVDSAPKPSTATTTFTFGGSPVPAAPSTPAISFGGTPSNKTTTTPQSPFSLGSAPSAGSNNAAFTFGPPTAPADKTEPAPKSPFSFGPALTTAKDDGAANPISFGFGSGPGDKKNESSSSSMFGFGATPSTPPISDADKKPSFGFTQTTTSAPTTSFSFGGGSTSDVSKPFSFSTAAMNPRPVTPPNQDQEIKMDESPTRDMQVTNGPKIVEPRPTLGVFPSFNNTSGGSSFGQSGGSMAPSFAFGAAPTSSNPFAKENKPEENKGFGGFSQSSGTSSGFPFTRKTSEDPPRPSTAGAFSFQSPNSATGSGSGSGFGFGGASNGATSTFPSGPLSAPNSPSTFNNPSPSFTFAAAPATTNPFAFGSQPASPATGTTNLPSVTSTGFGGGFGGSSNPFGAASTTPAAPSSGGTLFTIGAAPSAPPNGMRQIKKLPTRRGAKR